MLQERKLEASLENISAFSRSHRQIHFSLRSLDHAHQRLGSKWDFSFLPTRTSTYSNSKAFTFQPHCHFILRLQTLGPAGVTWDSALLFNKKGSVKNRLEKERAEEGRAREGRGESKGEGKQGHRSFSCFPLGYRTLPYPCISEMLIKGQFPEELSARLGPARFRQIKFINLQRGHRFSPGEWFWVWARVLSAGFCSSLLSEGKCYLHPGRGGTGFTLEPVPETVDKAEMQGFLRKRRIPTSFRFLACKSQAHVYVTRPISVTDTD